MKMTMILEQFPFPTIPKFCVRSKFHEPLPLAMIRHLCEKKIQNINIVPEVGSSTNKMEASPRISVANERRFFSPPEIPRITLPWPPIGVSAHFPSNPVGESGAKSEGSPPGEKGKDKQEQRLSDNESLQGATEWLTKHTGASYEMRNARDCT